MSRKLVIGLIVVFASLVPAGTALGASSIGIGAFGCPESGHVSTRGITHDADFEDWANPAFTAGHGSAIVWGQLPPDRSAKRRMATARGRS
jgi:hypothetical protein